MPDERIEGDYFTADFWDNIATLWPHQYPQRLFDAYREAFMTEKLVDPIDTALTRWETVIEELAAIRDRLDRLEREIMRIIANLGISP